MKIGEYGDYFGVINIGDTANLIKACEAKGIVSRSEEFVSTSLFSSINDKESKVRILIGSRKFTEGWNSWRVSVSYTHLLEVNTVLEKIMPTFVHDCLRCINVH